jgi:hypothetical protein
LLTYSKLYEELKYDFIARKIFDLEDTFYSLRKSFQDTTSNPREAAEAMNNDQELHHPLIQETSHTAMKYFTKHVNKYENEERKIICFLYLDFIQESYGDDKLKPHKHEEIFEKRFHLLSESFKLIEEMSRIEYYLWHLSQKLDLHDLDKSPRSYVEDIKLIQKYLKIVSNKHDCFTKDNLDEDAKMNFIYSKYGEISMRKLRLMKLLSSVERKFQGLHDLNIIELLKKL